jgi:hypothetical protein
MSATATRHSSAIPPAPDRPGDAQLRRPQTSFVVGPDAFGHGVVAGSLLLVIESARVLSLVVLFPWAVSVGARPWRASRGVGVTQQIFVTVIVLAASMMLIAIMVGATLYAFGAHLG